MPSYHVVTLMAPGNIHAACFAEMALLIQRGIEGCGYWCTTAINRFDSGAINIILGANSCALDFNPGVPYIVVQLEQLSDTEGWWSESRIPLLKGAVVVWDYSRENISFLASKGITARYLPIGYHAELERIPRLADSDRDIDVLFFGSLNGRRREVLGALRGMGLRVEALFGVYGDERDAVIARSKVVVNIHFYEASIFEAVRVSYLLNNGCAVVSEGSKEYPWPGVDLFMKPIGEIAGVCAALVARADLRERYARGAADQFKERYPAVEILRELMAAP